MPRPEIDNADATECLRTVMRVLIDESDRGCVLAGAAWLDELLGNLLMAKFNLESDGAEKSINFLLVNLPEPPLQNSGRKRHLCRALGLISDEMLERLGNLFRIRSRYFAHFSGPRSLADTDIQKDVHAFVKTYDLGWIPLVFADMSEAPMSFERQHFIATVALLWMEIGLAIKSVQKSQSTQTEDTHDRPSQ
ncbi:MAG TPA: hypothetical protein VIK18_07405 [Pirellulales bacterium]